MFGLNIFCIAIIVGSIASVSNASLCSLVLSVDITKGTQFPNGTILSENVLFPSDTYFPHGNSIRGCPCRDKPCLRKCCPSGQIWINKTCQEHEGKFSMQVHNYEKPIRNGSRNEDQFMILNSKNCDLAEFYVLAPNLYEEDAFFLQSDGSIYMPNNTPGQNFISADRYCVDIFIDDELDEEVSAMVCLPGKDKLAENLLSLGMIISMPFLLLTFIVYACLPDRNMHGKSLMCYVITLFGAYCFLVYMQLSTYVLPDAVCKTMGLTCYFLFLVSFFWMNVMSIDIWWAFSGLRGFSGSKKEVEQKRFVLYSLYAWGCPLLLVSIVALLIFIPNVPPNVWYNPGIGTGQCWFRNDYPVLVFFYGPIALIIIANITFFSITIYKIKQVQRDTSMLRKDESKKHSYENDKQRFNLYVKLMLAMGINWSMEIISWVIIWQVGSVPPAIWYLTDFCNALYGVFIFFIFVFKRNIWRMLKRRYYLIMGKPHLARAVTQTGYSSRTTGSSLNNTVTTDCKSAVDDSSVLTSQVA